MSELQNNTQIFGELGTFWSRTLAPGQDGPARRIVRTAGCNALVSQLAENLQRLTQAGWVEVNHLDIRFDKRKIRLRRTLKNLRTQVVSDTNALSSDHALEVAKNTVVDPDVPTIGSPFGNDQGFVFVDEHGAAFVLPNNDISAQALASVTPISWLVPVPDRLRPFSLQSSTGPLLLGQDFTIAGDALEFFREPTSLFPDDIIHVVRGVRRQSSLLGYTLQVDQLERPVEEVARYYRYNQSVTQLARAAAAAAGYVVLPIEATVQEIHADTEVTSYVMQDGSLVVVDYPHEALVVGQTYAGGTVVGRPFELFGPVLDRPYWYRDAGINWTGGLSLERLGAFPALSIPDGNVTATRVGLATDLVHWHCRFPLAGPSGDADRFWNRAWVNEETTGRYLADLIGIDGATASVVINPLDVVFQTFLRERALVVMFRTIQAGPQRERLLNFILREKPVTAVLIVNTSPAVT